MDLLATLESKYQLPNGLLNAVMQQESGGNVDAVSPKGARGAFQFMPATAKQYGVDTSDFNSSADGAARMYSDLLKHHNGDLDKALASYNYGQGNVEKHGMDNLPKETKNYIVKVKSKLPQVDYDAIAAEHGGTQAAVDYDALAKEHGAIESPTAPLSNAVNSNNNVKLVNPQLQQMYDANKGDKSITLKDIAGGLSRGALDVGGGLAMPLEYAYDKITGNTGTHDARVKRIDDKFANNYDTNSNTYKNSRTGGQIIATLPIGEVLGAGAAAAKLPYLANALKSGGMALGKEGGNAIINGATRVAGGIGTGAATDALINNGGDGTGAAIGGALPIVTKAAGLTGKALAFPLKYLTNKGQNNLVSDNIINMLGEHKNAFIDRLNNAKGSTEGFNPTVGQAGGSHEITSFERALQQRNPALFQETVNNQNIALANAAKNLGADDATIAALHSNRENAVKHLYNESSNAEVVSDKQLEELMKRPNVQEAFKAAKKNAENRGENLTAGQWVESNLIHDNTAPEKVMKLNRVETARGPKISGGNEENLMQSIKKMGGINLAEIEDITGEKTGRAARAQVGIFHRNGLGTDDLSSQLHDKGFIPSDEMQIDGGVSYLKEAIKNHIQGAKQYALHDTPLYAPDVSYLKNNDAILENRTSEPIITKSNMYSGKTLQEVKFALDKFKEFNPMASSAEKATMAGSVDASNAFNEYLGEKIPSIKKANNLYSQLSKPIDQANLGNALHEKFVPAIYRGQDSPVFEGGANSLNIPTLAKVLNNKETGTNLAKHVTGFSGATLENTLSPKQYQNLKNIVSDSEFINYGKTAGANGGSQTAQLQFMNAKAEKNGMVSHLMKNGSLPMRTVQAIKEFAVKPLEQKTAFILQNPKEAAKLLDSRLSKIEKDKILVNLIANKAKYITPIAVSSQSK